MAIIVDPDNLDRFQVIFGTQPQKLSIYPVGAVVTSQASTGTTTAVGTDFIDGSADFVTDTVAAGDILVLLTGADAGHYIVASVTNATTLAITTDAEFTGWVATDTALVYTVQQETGGSVVDGATIQSLYSFGKIEWRADTQNFGTDDLIRHEFLFEAITSEQFEIGGGDAHDSWTWFNEYTRKKVRTGGWADKNLVGTTLEEWMGTVTLGSLDADTQVYYQQTSATTTPVDFTFQGPVNESIMVFEDGGDDNRTYLKLFARKKGRTYAQSEISDIGVTTIQTIVNRFPLSHASDAAIAASDAAILGTSPFRDQGAALVTDTDGSKTAAGNTFTSVTDFAAAGVVAGDVLNITSGTEQGYYTILSVATTTLTIDTDFEFTTAGWSATEATLSFNVSSTVILAPLTDGSAIDVDSATGTFTNTAATDFAAEGVAAGDFLVITEPADPLAGVYKITNVATTTLTINTADQNFPAVSQGSVDFHIVEPGMYLQYKEEALSLAAPGNLTFADANPDTIQRASGSWVTDGLTAGSVITVTGSTNNNASYTVASFSTTSTADDTAVLVATDTLIAEGPVAATATAYDAFKRDIGGIIYAFHWRLFGNSATLANCYQFVQHQLRQTFDIDYGNNTFRGDVTDLLMAFSTPTGTMFDLYIDDLASSDINNATFQDATGVSRNFPFLAGVTLAFNVNLQNDANAKYWLFYSNDDAGDNLARDYGTAEAILVKDSGNVDVTGNISAATSVSFSYDYDGNVLRGAASAGTDAPVTLICIGLETAQFVLTTGTISRSSSQTISAVAALERNYLNPA